MVLFEDEWNVGWDLEFIYVFLGKGFGLDLICLIVFRYGVGWMDFFVDYIVLFLLLLV